MDFSAISAEIRDVSVAFLSADPAGTPSLSVHLDRVRLAFWGNYGTSRLLDHSVDCVQTAGSRIIVVSPHSAPSSHAHPRAWMVYFRYCVVAAFRANSESTSILIPPKFIMPWFRMPSMT